MSAAVVPGAQRDAHARSRGLAFAAMVRRTIAIGLVGLGAAWLELIPAAQAQDRPSTPRPTDRPTQAAPLRTINVAFTRHSIGAWTAKIPDGSFDTATGRTLKWVAHDTDSAVAAAIGTQRFDIGLMGAAVAAAAIARGLDLKIFYVLSGPADGEALLATPASGILPADARSLQGKVVAVPFGSSSHFRLLEGLKRWGTGPSALRIVNLQTAQIADAWKRGEIDAAVVTEPLLGTISAEARRVPLPTVNEETSIVFAASGEFVAQHTVVLSRFVDLVSSADAAWRSQARKPDIDSPEAIAAASAAGLPLQAVPTLMGQYRPPPLEVQASSEWLAGGASAGLLVHLKASLEIWRWAGRLAGAEVDLQAVAAPEPVKMALTYKR